MKSGENCKESAFLKMLSLNNNKRTKNSNNSIADKTGIFSNGEAFYSLKFESNDTSYKHVCSG